MDEVYKELPTSGIFHVSRMVEPRWLEQEPDKALTYVRMRVRRDLSDRLGQILESGREYTVSVWEVLDEVLENTVLTLHMSVFIASVDAALVGDAVAYADVPHHKSNRSTLPDGRTFVIESGGRGMRYWRRES